MVVMVRKQVYIAREQEARLKHRASALQASEAELIRAALDRYLDEPAAEFYDPAAWPKEREYIRALIAKGPVAGGRSWTREELHER